MNTSTATRYTLDSLFISDNGEIICNRHHPIATRSTWLNEKGGPASDYRWLPLSDAETVEWTARIVRLYGPDAPACETCRGVRERIA